MNERIDHVAEARMHIEWAHDQQGRAGEFDESVQHNATLAVAEATLALVEQQRIANLIALARMESENESTPTDALLSIYEKATQGWEKRLITRPEIKKALGTL